MNKNSLIMLVLFFLTQLIGIGILIQYVDFAQSAQTGKTQLTDEYVIAPPQVANESYTFISLFIAIIIGTALVFLIIKYGQILLWKLWFMASVSVGLFFAFSPFFAWSSVLLILICIIFAYWKIFHYNKYIHTFTEMFVYGGIAAIFVPILNVYSASALIIILAIYDWWMVNKSGHMITMAQSQLSQGMMTGLYVSNSKPQPVQTTQRHATHYKQSAHSEQSPQKKVSGQKQTSKNSDASVMVGGGDITFPLLFAGAAMKYFGTILPGVLIVFGATVGLYILFSRSKSGTFYPAIPFVGAGAFVGFFLAFLL